MKWEDNIRKVVPYVPGEQPKNNDIIKLNTNESPYPPSPLVREAIKNTDTDILRKYPDTNASLLVSELSRTYGLDEDRIFVGIGSDDVLALSFLTYFNSDKPVIFPDITYSFYDVWADLYRIPYKTMALDDDFNIVKSDYLCDNGGVVIANPNAPTGAQMPLDDIEEIIAFNKDRVVIVDEAYIDFGAESAVKLTDKYDNLVVVQTFSKSRALAGIRIGVAFGQKKIIDYLKDVKFSFNSYTLNPLTIAVGAAALKDDAYFKEITAKTVATRERVKKELKELGFTFADSKTNFIFAKHGSKPAAEIFEALKKENIYVRYFKKPRIDNYLRISMGTDEQMDKMLLFLKGYLNG
ncbi:MAG: histidinol-phosphate transaminase [Lachnospiraceae bacterium]|nr:histidinol-phosphate transaminase [Lachnospiraceae bacterium]